jgi:hypothetical protein
MSTIKEKQGDIWKIFNPKNKNKKEKKSLIH